MASTAPIGVFDSGLGGISVAREIRRDMPNEHVLYFGDSANAPYGTKSPEQVRELSDVIVKRFVEQGVKAVVIACNTATSAAANELRDTYDIPIIGMEPALKVACDRGHGKRQHVIVAATPLTLRERKFAVLMDRFKADHTIFPEPCPGLVEIVEHGQLDKILQKYEHNPELQLKGKLLPIPSNQKMNSYLKEIGTICNIHKNLTTHCARHTFATLAIEYGMPIDIIAKILGHTNTNMTRHYAKISEANISREMQRIGKVLTA